MKKIIRIIPIISIVLSSLACAHTKPQTNNIPQNKSTIKPTWYTAEMPAWKNHEPISWRDKINPVWWWKNIDDPVPPKWYEPNKKEEGRKLDWQWRNPFSNFCNYVIGVADKDTHRSGRYPKSVGNPYGGWNIAVTRYYFIYLPFVDYRAKSVHFEFYLGWRERGNFGIACRSNHSDPLPPQKPE